MKIDIFTQDGKKKGDATLPKEMFEVEFNADLLHMALKRQLANSRVSTAHTKDRSDVRGGGRKPHRQKGTGRARQGSRRSPLNKGGGVTFGPSNARNFEIQMPKKQRRKALFIGLSVKAKESKVFGLENYTDKAAKTKAVAEMITKLPVERSVLFVTPEKNTELQRASKNLSNAKTITVNYLNLRDLQKYDSVCFVGDSIDKAKEVFSNESK